MHGLVFVSFILHLSFSAELTFYRLGEKEPVTQALEVSSDLERISVRDLVILVDPEMPRSLIFSSRGHEVKRSSELAKGGTFYLVPPGKLWMWTPQQRGEKVTFEATDVIPSPTGSLITMEALSLTPRVFYVQHLISESESVSLIQAANDNLKSAQESREDTRAATFIADDDLAKKILERICSLLRVSCEERAVDGIEVTRYLPGQVDPEEEDYENTSPALYATFLIDLSDVTAGGQTMFSQVLPLEPDELKMLSRALRPILSPQTEGDNAVDEALLARNLGRNRGEEFVALKQCHQALSVRPKRYGTLMYYNTDSVYVPDPFATHSTCPVCNGTKWAAKIKIWTGPRQATGAPVTIQVTFTNTMGQPMEVKWKYQNERKLLVTVQPGETSQHTTFDNHEFEFYILGQLVDGLVVTSRNGLEQNVNIPTTGPQPIASEIQVFFINNFPVPLAVTWVNGHEGVFLNEIPPGGHSIQQTVHGHFFEFSIRESEGEERRVVQAHVMDGSLGPQQEVVLGSEEDEISEEGEEPLEEEKLVHPDL